jgi:hypothetical protein
VASWWLAVWVPVLQALTAGVMATDSNSAEAAVRDQTLAAIRECVTKSPPPWPQAWVEEYVATVRDTMDAHKSTAQYQCRLDILRRGFPTHWDRLTKAEDRLLFQVHRCQIRWYVEALMTTRLLEPNEKQELGHQWQNLMSYAADSLLAQFPFLDPNAVWRAKVDQLEEYFREIEVPLLPVFQQIISEQQVSRIRERWHALRYARVDVWRQESAKATGSNLEKDRSDRNQHPDYVLAQRSFSQWRGQIWIIVTHAPDYCVKAVSDEMQAQRQRFESNWDTWSREAQPGAGVAQTDRISLLLAALLETGRDSRYGGSQEKSKPGRQDVIIKRR